jgi:hypothetical protein
MNETLLRWFFYAYNTLIAPPTDEELRDSLSELKQTHREPGPPDINSHTPHSKTAGMCMVIFPGGKREPFCADGIENDDCQAFARRNHGIARPVIPGSECP